MVCKTKALWLLMCFGLISNAIDVPMVIVVLSYNNSDWYQQNLDSIRMQTYPHYHIIYIDDCSTDGTADCVAAYALEHAFQHKITILKNAERQGMLYNLYTAVHLCPDCVVIAVLDGDDWFAHPDVLTRVNEAYQDPKIWMTYGQFQEYPSGKRGFCAPIPSYIIDAHAYRLYDWVTSHLKTFYAGLFKQIPVEYFMRKGAFLKSAGDCAVMFALLELAGGRAAYIPDVLYIYNMTNVQSVCRTRPLEQLRNMYWTRNCDPLAPLTEHPAQSNKE